MTKTINKDLIKENLYQAVNGEWLKTAKIPADKSSTGGFADLADNIEKLLMSDFEKMLTNPDSVTDPSLKEFIKFYALTSDFKKRDAAGFEPVKSYLSVIEQLDSFETWEKQLGSLTFADYPMPFSIYLEPDMKNTTAYALTADVPSLILPDKTYYEEDNESSKALLDIYTKMLTKLFKLAGYSADATDKIITGTLAFDRSIVPYVKDSTELADYVKSYNKYTFTDFLKFSDNINLKNYIEALIHDDPDQVIVAEPKFYEAFDKIINPEAFDNMRSWLLSKTLLSVSSSLSDEARIISGEYSRAISGSKEPMSPQKSAFYQAVNVYSQVVGLYYAHKYFGAEAKADVTDMVKKMINIYKERLQNNDWLGEETRKKAILKLEKLGIQVGYPDKLKEIYKKFIVEGTDLFNNTLKFTRLSIIEHYNKWKKPVDRTEWEMSASNVNAYYHPSYNIIVFPAAILQAPFYSLNQSSSENFGGIGAVIAHEISHAFDNNGSHFDEFGNLNNWWSDSDLEHFQKLADAMIAEFDGLETPAGKVNGKLVVSENIADVGGLNCALEAAKKEEDVNLKDFFFNWARVWCLKSSLERQKLLLNIDVHAPHELRANIQPQNLADFYSTFNISSGDGMYLPEEKRVVIW
mgnify:FL=1